MHPIAVPGSARWWRHDRIWWHAWFSTTHFFAGFSLHPRQSPLGAWVCAPSFPVLLSLLCFFWTGVDRHWAGLLPSTPLLFQQLSGSVFGGLRFLFRCRAFALVPFMRRVRCCRGLLPCERSFRQFTVICRMAEHMLFRGVVWRSCCSRALRTRSSMDFSSSRSNAVDAVNNGVPASLSCLLTFACSLPQFLYLCVL